MNVNTSGLRYRLRRVADTGLDRTQRSVLLSWAGFTTTFGVTRAITYTLHRKGAGGSGGITIKGRHIHHYNFGIAILMAVGGVAVRGESQRLHPAVAAAYGSGVALIVDELALLVDLKDVYWAQDGRKSVDVAIGLIGLAGAYFAGREFWHAVGRELVHR